MKDKHTPGRGPRISREASAMQAEIALLRGMMDQIREVLDEDSRQEYAAQRGEATQRLLDLINATTDPAAGHHEATTAIAEALQAETGTPFDAQEGGAHYQHLRYQPAICMHLVGMPPMIAAAFKYICRHRHKGGVDDIRKAIHYVRMHRELAYGDEPQVYSMNELLEFLESNHPTDDHPRGLTPADQEAILALATFMINPSDDYLCAYAIRRLQVLGDEYPGGLNGAED